MGHSGTQPVCCFIVLPYMGLPGGNQQICGATARSRLVDGREINLCDEHLIEVQQALAAGATELVTFDEGPDGTRMLVIQAAWD